jgi:hypothetical protein
MKFEVEEEGYVINLHILLFVENIVLMIHNLKNINLTLKNIFLPSEATESILLIDSRELRGVRLFGLF